MSKVDALRALREARYAAAPSAKPSTATSAKPSSAPVVARPAAKAASAVPRGAGRLTVPASGPDIAAEADPCGHRSMNGRTCTRPGGHAEKNHRYG